MANEPQTQADMQTENEEAHGFFDRLEQRAAQLMHDVPEAVHDVFRRHRRTAFERHPFLFSTLGLLGLVVTWQAMDDIIEEIAYFDQNPVSLLLIGLLVLLLTGRLYRQLDQTGS